MGHERAVTLENPHGLATLGDTDQGLTGISWRRAKSGAPWGGGCRARSDAGVDGPAPTGAIKRTGGG